MNLKPEEQEVLKKIKDKSKDNKTPQDHYLQSIAESLAVIAHKIGRKYL